MSIPYSAKRLRRKHVEFFDKYYKGKPFVVKALKMKGSKK